MKLVFIILIAVSFASAPALHGQQQPPLTNEAVVKLVRAGFKEKTIISIIRSRPNRFVLDPEKLIELKRSRVSENIILAMLAQDDSFVLTDDEWADDFGFGGRKTTERNPQAQAGTDIFGSSEGSKAQTRNRGADGASQGETTTTGTATVRILRPTDGGTAAKLERTPTLNNEAVIRLVEAGFSEGTIIRRIEDSPSDFDLSAPKLEELHRRRVNDTVIAAMRAAMNDDAFSNPPPKAGKN